MNFSRRVLFHRKTDVCLRYFGQDCFRKQSFFSNSKPRPFKFDLFNNFGNSKVFDIMFA